MIAQAMMNATKQYIFEFREWVVTILKLKVEKGLNIKTFSYLLQILFKNFSESIFFYFPEKH